MDSNARGRRHAELLGMAAAAGWMGAGVVLIVDPTGDPPIFLGIVAGTLTLLMMHVWTRLPAVDLFEHGYRAGWEDRESLDAMTLSAYPPSSDRVVPIRCRQKVRR